MDKTLKSILIFLGILLGMFLLIKLSLGIYFLFQCFNSIP